MIRGPARLALALALLLVASGAAAQDAAGDAAEIEACLGAADDRAAARGCVGRVADRCMSASPDGATTLGMAECLSAETAAWDRILNADWKRARAAARAHEASGEAEAAGATPGTEAALIAAQRAWIAFRDAECGLRYAMWIGGTFRVIAAGTCLRDMTAERVLDIREYLEEGGGL